LSLKASLCRLRHLRRKQHLNNNSHPTGHPNFQAGSPSTKEPTWH
jgi:hypothetical protein